MQFELSLGLGYMARKKRHSPAEIATKVAQADELAAQGKLQGDIAGALGISVMTLHRWRKMVPEQPAPVPPATSTGKRTSSVLAGSDEAQRIAELKLENSRLRRLVADLMLEKLMLEEESESGPAGRRAKR